MTSSAMPVVDLWRYPVKSVGGERVSSCEVTSAGLLGDRQWGIVDNTSGTMLTARRAPELLFASARLLEPGTEPGSEPGTWEGMGVEITLPDGTIAADDAALSAWLNRDVSLIRARDDGQPQTYEIALDFENEDDPNAKWVSWQGPGHSFHDSTRTAVSILSTGGMRSWDRRRFRGNVIVEAPTETTIVNTSVNIGSAVLDVVKAIDRCVIVTRPQPGGAEAAPLGRDLDVLRTINTENARMLGAGCLVTRPGVISVGDSVMPAI